MKRTKRTTLIAMCVALAMILSYVESQIPTMIPVPGVKMGLANIVVVFTLYKLGMKEAVGISLLRIFLLALLFGSVVSLLYSVSGAVLSLLFMFVMKKTDRFTTVAVSVVGGVMHNIGQCLMACIVMNTDIIRYYLPFLLISGILAGIVIGVLAAIMVNRIDVQ